MRTDDRVEGDICFDVALPLIVQPVNDLKSEVGVRLIDLCQ